MTTATASVPARAHLAGNPSDGYGGAVLSTTVPSMSATVNATRADRFVVHGPEESWASLSDLAASTERLGFEGGDRLVRAALLALDGALDRSIERRPATFEWSTTIPRSVGLGGSSAIVLATMRAALRLWSAEHAVDDLELASLALEAETGGLGIVAGIADRTVQALGGVVLTDARRGLSVTTVRATSPVSLSLLWRLEAAAPSGDYHRVLRAAVEAGDDVVVDGLARLASLADDAARAVTDGDHVALARAMDESLRTRQSLGRVPSAALEGVDALRQSGAAVNFAGSGGAVVVLGPCRPPRGWRASAIELTPHHR